LPTKKKKIANPKKGHFPDEKGTFAPAAKKKKGKKKTGEKNRSYKGVELLSLGSREKGPRTARGHFDVGARQQWSIGAPLGRSPKTG